ncbi:MAG: galactokinase, partial [Flavobacteriales bacterium]|nr:galactokinase [Flavobacteriales bacterium]
SKAPRQLASSAYNSRRAECDAALSILGEKNGVEHLTQADMDAVGKLDDPILRQRARHVVTEQQRVIEAAMALRSGDLVHFGHLLNESHASLRDDYEVSSPQLDHIVATAQQHDGCLGARLTGAGFGGCCIALIETDAIPGLRSSLDRSYRERFDLPIKFHPCSISDGVRMLTDG